MGLKFIEKDSLFQLEQIYLRIMPNRTETLVFHVDVQMACQKHNVDTLSYN